jgi:NAD(P)-dependent dehydrogenase (short-subunit alcohol dehydrogenase family)
LISYVLNEHHTALCFEQLTEILITLGLHVCHDLKFTLISCVDALAAAFEKHVHMYGGLDVCINCAGFISKSLVYDDTSNGINTWRRSINVNLVAVVDGTRIAVSLPLTIGVLLRQVNLFSNSNYLQ